MVMPITSIAGAITGGSLGFLFGASADLAFDDPRLDDFASAVMPFGGKLILTDLNEDDIKVAKGLKIEEKAIA